MPANTFIAIAEAVVRAGCWPRFADVDPDYLLLDPGALRAALTQQTGAVIPAHLFGQMAPMAAIADAGRRGTVIIEDAAQAHGATQGGRAAGSFGLLAGVSFYPGKNLGAYGDAGAVLYGVSRARAAGPAARRSRIRASLRAPHRRVQFPA